MRVVVRAACLSAALVAAVAAPSRPARAKEARTSAEFTLPKAQRHSVSLGLPWKGHLQRGLRLEADADVRVLPDYAAGGHQYGTWRMVQLLRRAARRVGQRSPRVPLSVGELSAERGGDLPGHASHESGRDADVGFYMLDAAGKSFSALAFANFDARGRGLPPNAGLRFDVARNWDFVARLLGDDDARVQYVFVSPWIRQLLLDEARRRGAAPALVARAAQVMTRANERHPHANHFHVRIYCGVDERPRCEDAGQIWDWYPGKPPLTASR
jgi:penicillin-insensitive murein DD-endopeptidase